MLALLGLIGLTVGSLAEVDQEPADLRLGLEHSFDGGLTWEHRGIVSFTRSRSAIPSLHQETENTQM